MVRKWVTKLTVVSQESQRIEYKYFVIIKFIYFKIHQQYLVTLMAIIKSEETRLQMDEVENQNMKDYIVTLFFFFSLNNYIVKLKKPKTLTIQTNIHLPTTTARSPLMVLGSAFCGSVARIGFQPYFIIPSPSQICG